MWNALNARASGAHLMPSTTSRSHDFDCMPVSCNWCIEEFFLNFGTTSSETSGSPCKIDGVLNQKQIVFISMERNDADLAFSDRNLDLNFFSVFFVAIYLRLCLDVERNNHIIFIFCVSANWLLLLKLRNEHHFFPAHILTASARLRRIVFRIQKKYVFIFTGRRYAWRFFERKWIFKSETHLIQLPHGQTESSGENANDIVCNCNEPIQMTFCCRSNFESWWKTTVNCHALGSWFPATEKENASNEIMSIPIRIQPPKRRPHEVCGKRIGSVARTEVELINLVR